MGLWRLCLLMVSGIVAAAWVVQQVELVGGGPYLAGGISAELALAALPVGFLAVIALGGRHFGVGERVLLYSGLAVGVTATASGLMHRFLPGLVTGFYGGFANPAGPYYPLLQQVPSWLVPGGVNEAPVVGAFEGAVVPWAAWVSPLLYWSLFFVGLFFTFFCLVWLLRRRWLETERLGCTLTELPMGLAQDQLWGRRSFWLGVGVPVVLVGANGLHHYFPAFPAIETSLDLSDFLLEEPWRFSATFESPFYFYFSPFLVGLAYLAPVEVSFSTWVFFLVSRLQLLATHFAGRLEERGAFIPGHGSPWRDWPGHFPFFMCQARGGLIFIALFGLWTARRTLLGDVRRQPWALAGLGLGFVGLWAWVTAAGLPPHLGALALLALVVLSLAFARLRLDGGLPLAGAPIVLGYLFFVSAGTGPGIFSDGTYVAFALLAVIAFTGIGMWPALQFEGLKMAGQSGVSPHRLAAVMGLGLVVGLASGYFFALETIYEHGLFTLEQQGGGRSEARTGRYYYYLLKDAATVEGPTDWLRLGFHLGGAAITWLLAGLRQMFLRWPLHPIGFVYGTGFGWLVWGSVLVGWLCKWLTVRYGGAATYSRVRPVFLGLIFGEISMRLFWGGVALWKGDMGGGYRF